MVTSKQLPKGAVVVKPQRRGLGGLGVIFFLVIALITALSLGVIGLFAPTQLAIGQERALGLIHGGVAKVDEWSYVDGCVQVEGADGPRAVTRTQRLVSYNDGTTLEVVFSGKPAPTNACP